MLAGLRFRRAVHLKQTCEVVAKKVVWEESVCANTSNLAHQESRGSPLPNYPIHQEVQYLECRQQCAALSEKHARFESVLRTQVDDAFLGESPVVVRVRMVKPHMWD